MLPPAPTFTVATPSTPVPVAPEILTIPSCVTVTAMATMSGTGVVDADSSKVLRPELTGAGSVVAQSKLNARSVGEIGALGVTAITKL